MVNRNTKKVNEDIKKERLVGINFIKIFFPK